MYERSKFASPAIYVFVIELFRTFWSFALYPVTLLPLFGKVLENLINAEVVKCFHTASIRMNNMVSVSPSLPLAAIFEFVYQGQVRTKLRLWLLIPQRRSIVFSMLTFSTNSRTTVSLNEYLTIQSSLTNRVMKLVLNGHASNSFHNNVGVLFLGIFLYLSTTFPVSLAPNKYLYR